MGKSADITMSNLKAATGIADDRLSAHSIAGAGTVNVGFSAFLFDDFITEGTDSLNQDFLLEGWAVRGTRQIGSYDSNDFWVYDNEGSFSTIRDGDKFSFFVGFQNGGRYVGDQIMSNLQHWTIQRAEKCELTQIKGIYNTGTNNQGAQIICTANKSIGTGNRVIMALSYSPPLNTDIPKANNSLVFRTDYAEFTYPDPILTISANDLFYSDSIRITYDIEQGTPNYSYTLSRRVPGTGSTWNNLDSGTYSSDVTNVHYRDYNDNNGGTGVVNEDYEYRLQVTDSAAQPQSSTEISNIATMPPKSGGGGGE